MSLKSIFRTVVFTIVVFCTLPVAAQVVSSKGMATINYEGKLRPADRQGAVKKALFTALQAHVSESSVAKAKMLAGRRDEFMAKLDTLIVGSTVLSETDNKDMQSYSVVVRAEIDAALLRAELDGGSVTANTSAAARSQMALVFVARMQDSVQSFEDREYRRVDIKAKSASSGSTVVRTEEGESIGDSRIGTSDTVSRTGNGRESFSGTVESGGSTTQKANKIVWKVTTAGEINSAMSGVLSGAGYEVVEAEYVEPQSGGLLSVARIRKDYSQGDDLSAEVLRGTTSGVSRAGIPLLAYGKLDVGIRTRDAATGLVRVTVTVTGQVLDVSGRFPRTVSSVGPVQFAGVGDTETVARTNALTMAAEKAALIMVDELNVRATR